MEGMAALRYEPCTLFINVSQRTLHIYFIDGCRVCPLDAQYKNRVNQPRLCASAHRGVPLYFCMARSYANFQLFAILQQFQRVGDNSIGVAFFQFLAVAEAPEDSYGEGSGGLAGLHICGGVSHVEYFVCGETELV